MFMLFDDESWYDVVDEQVWMDAMKAHQAFAEAVEAAGARILDGNALQRSSSATTIRNGRDGGDPITTDGPFIETKEAIGGYYVIEATDLDQALALAAKCPSPIIEVRPVMDVSGGTPSESGA
jgi:hypothetical protein